MKPTSNEKLTTLEIVLKTACWIFIVFGCPLLLASSCDQNQDHSYSFDRSLFFGWVIITVLITGLFGVWYLCKKFKEALNGEDFWSL